jgi:hypothetical protein
VEAVEAVQDAAVQFDVNGDRRFDLLLSHSDWSELSYYFLETPAYGGAHADQETVGAEEDVTAAGLPAVHFLVVAPAAVSPNMPFDVTVTAVDQNGNVVTNYQGTISFLTTDSDPGVVLPPNYTFTSADAGVHMFLAAVSLVTHGDQALSVVDADGFTVSATVTVTQPQIPPEIGHRGG